MPMYLNQSDNSNKFWGYEINGNKITFKWGRVGLDGQEQTESYSPAKLQKKIREKIAKGYEEITEQKLEKETVLAESIGFRTKVQSIDFVTVSGDNQNLKTSVIGEYDPDEYILVHLQNSWNPDEERFVLLSAKNGHKTLTRKTATSKNVWRSYDGGNKNTAQAIMDYLQDMIDKFTKIVTASFGNLGGRALDDDSYQKAVTKFKAESKSDMSDAVVQKIAKMGFASMGARALDL